MAAKSPTYSVVVPSDCAFDFQSGWKRARGEIKAGTYRVPQDLRHDIAGWLCQKGLAEKKIGGRKPEAKAPESEEQTEGGE